MLKIGEFIYPWGSGHYSRMMRFTESLKELIQDELEIHFSSKDHVYDKLIKKFPEHTDKIHQILMPTPIDGKFGPSVSKSLLNILFSVEGNKPLVKQIASYLLEERKLYDQQQFDLVINDGDMGSNILAKNRDIPSLFVTNQFRPKLYNSRSYLYPSLIFIAKSINDSDLLNIKISEFEFENSLKWILIELNIVYSLNTINNIFFFN